MALYTLTLRTNLEHFMESIIYILYIFFQSSGSQESNASNGTWIGVETKKLWSFKDNHIKLCENFAAAKRPLGTRAPFHSLTLPFHSCEMSYETHLWHTSAISQPMSPSSQLRTTLRNHPQAANEVANHLQVVKSHSTCKIKVQTWKMDNSPCEIHLCNLRYLLPTKLDFFSRYFV